MFLAETINQTLLFTLTRDCGWIMYGIFNTFIWLSVIYNPDL